MATRNTMLSCPVAPASPRASITLRTISAAAERNCSPAAVRRVGKQPRSIRGVPTQVSSDWMRRLKADCDTWRSSAAVVNWPHSARVRKSWNQRRSITITA
ncbi:Uncharacterised protein [Bordetella pertussis]|nr:Uncharacterised protein [Bordetella pertussis]CPQ64008.1 Uncharacterised protein [Bordetella pertussis]CRE32389.1 Uncharacterised protein [Bordetella pertussis]